MTKKFIHKIRVFTLGLLLFLPTLVLGKGVETVVIDAGHGGKDPGTVSRSNTHYHEKVITLKIAKKVGKYIENNYPNVKVIYTRTKDVYLTLNQRAKIANKSNADLFISIHVDAVQNSKVRGASVYVLGLHRSQDNLKVAMRENAVMLQEEDYKAEYAGFDPTDPESYIIFSLMQNQHLDNSMLMASYINKHLKSKTKRITKGIKQAGFYVLREVAMPSVLVETGYITNSSDAKFLSSADGQNKTALAIFNAFRDYKNHIETNTSDLTKVENFTNSLDNADTFFTVQLLYGKQGIKENSKEFKGLSPIYEVRVGNGSRYNFGKTINYNEALKLQKQAKKYFKDAYIVGYHKGERKKWQEIKDILKAVE